MNSIVLIGRLTRDPELRYIAGTGTPVANFALAVDREYSKDAKKETDFINIQVWGKTAENCANYIGKGSLVAIQGSLRNNSYQNEAGEIKRYTLVNANRVQFLDSKNKSEKSNQEPKFEPSFDVNGLDPQGFQAIDDDDIPF